MINRKKREKPRRLSLLAEEEMKMPLWRLCSPLIVVFGVWSGRRGIKQAHTAAVLQWFDGNEHPGRPSRRGGTTTFEFTERRLTPAGQTADTPAASIRRRTSRSPAVSPVCVDELPVLLPLQPSFHLCCSFSAFSRCLAAAWRRAMSVLLAKQQHPLAERLTLLIRRWSAAL